MPDPDWTAPATVGAKRFELVRSIGSGSMGAVYEALDRVSGARVALKRLIAWSPERLSLFKQEFRLLAGLSHPNLVVLGELFEDRGDWFFSMELLRGAPFLAALGAEGGDARMTAPLVVSPGANTDPASTAPRAIDERRLRQALVQVGRGLLALHRAGHVHRDVKPANIVVTDQGRAVLVDFGLIGDAGGTGAGSPAYMAPEQVERTTIGPPADWYALGVTLFEALTGRLPFEGGVAQIRARKLSEAAPPPRALRPDVPESLDRLCHELLSRDPAARPSGLEVLERVSERSRPRHTTPAVTETGAPLEARHELDLLRAAFEEVGTGHPVTVLLHGPEGRGERRLVDALAALLGRTLPQPLVLRGRCREHEAVPFKALDELVDGLQRHLAGLDRAERLALLPDDAAAIATLFPVLGAVHDRGGLEGTPHRARAIDALRALLDRLGRGRRLVLIIEDLHHADADSLRALAELTRSPDAPWLLWVLTSREEEHTSTDARVRFELHGDVRRIELAPLPVEAREPAAGLDAGVIAARLGALDDRARGLLQFVAAAGALRTDTLRDAAALSPEAARPALELLRTAGLVQPAGRAGEDAVVIAHARVAEVTLGALAQPQRAAVHRLLAAAISREPASDGRDARLARHHAAAGDLPRAREAARRAAEQAERALAFARAAELWSVCVDAAPEADRAIALERRAEARFAAGRGGEAGRDFLAAAERAEPARALELRRSATQAFLQAGHVDEAAPVMRALLAGDGAKLARSPATALASLLWRRAILRVRGLGFSPRGVERVDAGALARVDNGWVVTRGLGVFDFVRGADQQSRHVLDALRLGEPVRVARALAVEASFVAAAGDGARAVEIAHRAIELAERTGDPQARGLSIVAAGFAALQGGRFRAGATLFDRGLEVLRRAPRAARADQVLAQVSACWCRAYLGELVELDRRLSTYLHEARDRGDVTALSNLRLGPGTWRWLAADRADEAQREIAEAIAAWGSEYGYQSVHCFHLLSRVQLLLYRGDGDGARQALDGEWPALERSFFLRNQLVRVVMTQLRGAVALAARGGRRGQVQAAAKRLDAEGVPWAAPQGAALRAGLAHGDGDRETAAGLLAVAAAGFDEADLSLHAVLARRQLGLVRGGDEGRVLREGADAWLAAQRVVRPEALAAVLLPGFTSA